MSYAVMLNLFQYNGMGSDTITRTAEMVYVSPWYSLFPRRCNTYQTQPGVASYLSASPLPS